jgi:hypothetical protein
MTTSDVFPLEGGCDCGAVRYRMLTAPMFVHCCHCTWCQRETGASFALNALIEAERVVLLKGEVDAVVTPSNSGKGQKISRCPVCRIALWSNYGGAGDAIRFVRVGTLDQAFRLKPDNPHFHVEQAAVGDPVARHAGRARVLRQPQVLAAGKHCAACGGVGV